MPVDVAEEGLVAPADRVIGCADGWAFCAIFDDGDLFWIGDVGEASLYEVDDFDIVIRHAVADEDDPLGLSQNSLRLIPDLGQMGVAIVL